MHHNVQWRSLKHLAHYDLLLGRCLVYAILPHVHGHTATCRPVYDHSGPKYFRQSVQLDASLPPLVAHNSSTRSEL